MLGIVVDDYFMDDEIRIMVYDYENDFVKVVTTKYHCIHSNYCANDFVYYDPKDGGIFKLYDDNFLMYIDELVKIYKSYLAMARDIKIDYLTKNNITLEYNNDEEAKELFKKVCTEKHIIRRLEKTEIFLKVLLEKMKEYISEDELYFKFFQVEVEKKHSYK